MFILVKNDIKLLEIEKEIMNSNTEYNLIAYDKALLGSEDILNTFTEANELQVERYLVKKDENYIAILDYGMSSPRQKKPWISLLAVHNKYQGLGYAKQIYRMCEDIMKDQGANCIQIAVHSKNINALNFWHSLGFIKYNKRTFEDKEFFSLEKRLG